MQIKYVLSPLPYTKTSMPVLEVIHAFLPCTSPTVIFCAVDSDAQLKKKAISRGTHWYVTHNTQNKILEMHGEAEKDTEP